MNRPIHAITIALLGGSPALAADLDVSIVGVAHARGQVHFALYGKDEGFRQEETAIHSGRLPARTGTVTTRLADLPPGRYAVIAYHDEDDDGKMDRFLGMVPTEGYGLSNNPEVSGPPQFKDSAFELTDGGAAIEIRLRY